MMQKDLQILKGVSSKTRFSILRLLMKTPKRLNVGAIRKQIGIESTLLSHHLASLKSIGLVTSTRSGKQLFYTMNTKSKNVEGYSIIAGEFSFKIKQ